MERRLLRFGLGLMRVVEAVSAVLLLAVVAMNLAQVFFRYVLVDPLSWSEETMRYSTTWMVMLAGSAALFRNEHMAIDLLGEHRSERLRKVRRLVVLACVAGFCLLMMWEGFPAALKNYRQVSPAVRVPMTLPYLAIPVGATLMFVKAILLMVLPERTLAEIQTEEPLA
ncbi:TRAP transporter small permease [Ostreiculturibacter nitratireducens]|uniref:TRAP transporter small permease n=1 Tax=Ostreiculturibacter nitratireducens TaxID=3075226 RepID=UPI0031B5BBE4